MLNDNFFQAIREKTDIAPLECPICQRQLSEKIECSSCEVGFALLRIDNLLYYLPISGRFGTPGDFASFLADNTLQLPGCPKCQEVRFHEQSGEMRCCNVFWMPVIKDGNIVYDVKSLAATHSFKNPINSLSEKDYAYRLVWFAAAHVVPEPEQANAQQTHFSAEDDVCHTPDAEDASSIAPEPELSDIAQQICDYLTEHETATTASLVDKIRCSRQALNIHIKFLLNSRRIQRIDWGVYKST